MHINRSWHRSDKVPVPLPLAMPHKNAIQPPDTFCDAQNASNSILSQAAPKPCWRSSWHPPDPL